MRWRVASAPSARWERDQRGDVEVGEHVAVGDDERVVDARDVGREADGPGGVERLGFDRVAQRHAGAAAVGEGLDERLGLEAERQRDLGDAAARQGSTSRSMMGRWPTGSIGLGMVLVSGRSRVPNPPTSTTARISPSWLPSWLPGWLPESSP